MEMIYSVFFCNVLNDFSAVLISFWFPRTYLTIICASLPLLQAMYNEFSTANIQIDKDFSAKLSGYGCVGHIPEEEISSSSSVSTMTYKCFSVTLKISIQCLLYI